MAVASDAVTPRQLHFSVQQITNILSSHNINLGRHLA